MFFKISMKKPILILSSLLVFMHSHMVQGFSKDDIIPSQNPTVLNATEDGTGLLDAVLLFFKDSLFALMALIAIAVFLYIWGKLIVARWNPEEFKKALMSFLYAVIGIFIVAFAWAAVKLVAGLNF